MSPHQQKTEVLIRPFKVREAQGDGGRRLPRERGSAAAEAGLQPLDPPLLTGGGEHQDSSGVGASARCSPPRFL